MNCWSCAKSRVVTRATLYATHEKVTFLLCDECYAGQHDVIKNKTYYLPRKGRKPKKSK